MSVRERFENHPVIFGASLLIAGFIAGLATMRVLIDIQPKERSSCTEVQWSSLARESEWIPRQECPAYPVAITIASPGAGAVVTQTSDSLATDLVVISSRPIPRENGLGLIVKSDIDPNYHVSFPYFSVDEKRKVFRHDSFIEIGHRPSGATSISLWAIAVEDERRFGKVYSNLEQIKKVDENLFVSPEGEDIDQSR